MSFKTTTPKHFKNAVKTEAITASVKTMGREVLKDGTRVLYSSPFALVSELDASTDKRAKLSSMRTGRESFSGAASWDDFKVKQNDGDLLAFTDLSDKLSDYAAEVIRDTTVADVSGAFVDVAAYLSGVPECMIDFTTENDDRNYVTIITDVAESAAVTTEKIAMKAALIKSIVDTLENQGTRVRVIASDLNGHTLILDTYVTVKEYDEPLHAATLNALHPSFLRFALFGAIELACDFMPPSGYGAPRREPAANELEFLGIEADERVIRIGTVSHNYTVARACGGTVENLSNYVNDIITIEQ
jgi:hypothetical protein